MVHQWPLYVYQGLEAIQRAVCSEKKDEDDLGFLRENAAKVLRVDLEILAAIYKPRNVPGYGMLPSPEDVVAVICFSRPMLKILIHRLFLFLEQRKKEVADPAKETEKIFGPDDKLNSAEITVESFWDLLELDQC
jgi:hypothetical protein